MPKAKASTATAKIYGVVGSDEAEVKRVGAGLAEELTPPDGGDFGLEVIDGAVDNADQGATKIRSTVEALQTMPFFGGAKLVWLKNANFLADNILGRSAAVQEALEELTDVLGQDLGDGVTFLLTAVEVDKRRSFYKSFAKNAEIQIFDGIDSTRSGWEEEATEIVRKHAKQKGLQFEDEALVLFVLLTGGDRRQIENELEKIDIFLGKKRSVTIEQVRDLVPLSRSGVIFELGNALAERDLERALQLVRRLLDQGESAIGILLVAILPTIRNLLLAGDLMSRYRMPRPACALPIYFRPEPPAGRSGGASPAKERRRDQRLRAWDCRAKCAPVRPEPFARRNGRLPGCQRAAGEHASSITSSFSPRS